MNDLITFSQPPHPADGRSPLARWRVQAALLCAPVLLLAAASAQAASSAACEGGGFTLSFTGGAPAVSNSETTVAAGSVGPTIMVRGRYVEFDIDATTFGIRNYTLTGAPNPLDITGGVRTVVFAAKTPDQRGLTLTEEVEARVDVDLVVERSGPGLTMKIQAKDCAQGGVFQMEPERDDDQRTVITHTLAEGVSYFDNQNFRDREGDTVPFKDTTIVVPNRINFGNAISSRFVGRDSAQVADRVLPLAGVCVNQFPNRPTIGGIDTVRHCGGVSVWSVASGGRMGQVMGEDSTEVAPPPTDCTQNCQAQNRVRGRAVVLGFPFPLQNVLQPRSGPHGP